MSKVNRMCCVYEAYTKDGQLVARGFADDVAAVVGSDKGHIGSYAFRGGYVKNKYLIKKIGMKEKVVETNIKYYDHPKKDNETFVERYWCLERYGTTEMSEEEYSRHQELIEDKGYNVKYTKIKIGKRRFAYRLEVV